jgi:hypothetical protein
VNVMIVVISNTRNSCIKDKCRERISSVSITTPEYVESDVERLRHHLRHLSARRDASDVALSASRSMGVRWSPGLCVLRGTARMVSGKLVETSFLTCEFFLIFQTINYELTTSGFGCRVSFTLTGAVV